MIEIPETFITECIDKFGSKHQLDILQEECAELIKAVSKYKRNILNGDDFIAARANLIEELTHVAISSEIVAKLISIEPDDIQAEIDKKSVKYNFNNI